MIIRLPQSSLVGVGAEVGKNSRKQPQVLIFFSIRVNVECIQAWVGVDFAFPFNSATYPWQHGKRKKPTPRSSWKFFWHEICMDPTFFGHKLIFTNLFVFLSLCIYVSVFLCLFATISVTLRICICICMSMCHVRIHVSLSASLYLYLKGVKKKRQLFIVWSFCVLYEYFCDCFAIHCLNKCPLDIPDLSKQN